MPTYACSTAAGRLTPAQKADIVRSITAIHHEETGAPRYFVQVIFYELAPGNHFIGGQSAPAGQIWIPGPIRAGPSEEPKPKVVFRSLPRPDKTTATPPAEVWGYPFRIPAPNLPQYRPG